MSRTLVQLGPLTRRSVMRIVRNPALAAQGIVFPLFLYAFNIGGLDLATKIGGFPTDSYPTFAIGLTFIYCGLFATTVAGVQLGEDIRTGFVRRLSLTRANSVLLLLAQLGGVVAFAVFQAVLFLVVGFVSGVHVTAGPAGAVLIVAYAALFAVAFGCVGLAVAMFTRSGESVQALFPLLMAALFFSSLNLPRELIQKHWFREVATFNPISYMVEAPRSLLVSGWHAQPLLLGVLVAVAVFATAIFMSAASLRTISVAR